MIIGTALPTYVEESTRAPRPPQSLTSTSPVACDVRLWVEMDAEEARKALDLSRKHDMNGNTEAALKWARKSVAIYSTPEAMALFTRLKEKGAQGGGDATGPSSAAKPSMEESESIYASTSTKTTSVDSDGHKKEYTEKQVEIVRRVKRAGGDFYAVLDIQKTATDSEVKKSYRKVCCFSLSDV